MILEVDPQNPTPVYEQIRGQVRRMIAAGTLTTGDRLPTIRQLAADLGLAKGTVAKAYETLLHDGVVEAAGRNGTVVTSSQPLDPAQQRAQLQAAARTYAVQLRQLSVDPAAGVQALQEALNELS